MRIIDKKNKKSLNSILIMLTPEEAIELASKVKSLDASSGNHIHVGDINFIREVTLAIYTKDNLDSFLPEIQNILTED
jgi:formylmethanofuran dehydrogenase subunit E-like metal-binding protein